MHNRLMLVLLYCRVFENLEKAEGLPEGLLQECVQASVQALLSVSGEEQLEPRSSKPKVKSGALPVRAQQSPTLTKFIQFTKNRNHY